MGGMLYNLYSSVQTQNRILVRNQPQNHNHKICLTFGCKVFQRLPTWRLLPLVVRGEADRSTIFALQMQQSILKLFNRKSFISIEEYLGIRSV